MIQVEGKSYNVYIGEGLLQTCPSMLKNIGITGSVAVIADDNVAPLYAQKLIDSLNSENFRTSLFVFHAGEKSKTLSTLEDILEFLAEKCFMRNDCVIALGGGVTGDLAGLAAGLYMRGIAWVQCPTSLLAAVDASVGGKTAVDLKSGKNLAGLFYAPKAVFCDTLTMQTLPENVFADGMAEVIKTALVGDAELFEMIEKDKYRDNIEEVIRRCVALKMRITDADEHDFGERRKLNLGHTPAHAIEKLSGYSVSHGSAVAAGMVIMCKASCHAGILSSAEVRKVISVLESCLLPTSTVYSSEQLARAALNDKKIDGESIVLVFPERIGSCRLETIATEKLEYVFGG